MENSQHIKSFNADSRGKNRLRYSSSKQKSKKVSADIYRSYKRQYGVTSAADREETIHRPKRTKAENIPVVEDGVFDETCLFAQELELAQERNSSELFNEFYREIWPLVRSLPELIHHSKTVIDLLLSYLLSPASVPNEKMEIVTSQDHGQRAHYIVNYATTDIMHLLAVLAKDLQQEIHPYVCAKIIPRFVLDFLSPPPPPPDSGRQAIPLDILVVETAFRSLSYILQHDSDKLVSESLKEGEEPCLESMRIFYGPTLGHKRDVVRRLAAETFAPLIRKIKTDTARKRHFKRIFRALMKSYTGQKVSKRTRNDAIDGIAQLLFETAKGTSGRLHSKGRLIVRYVLDFVNDYGREHADLMNNIASTFLNRLYHHISSGVNTIFDGVWEEIHKFFKIGNKKGKDSTQICYIRIIQDSVEFRNGFFFKSADINRDSKNDTRLKSILKIASDLTEPSRLMNVPEIDLRVRANFFFSAWNLFSASTDETSFFKVRLNEMMASCKSETFPSPYLRKPYAIYLIESLLETSIDTGAKYQTLPAVISALSRLTTVDRDQVFNLLFRVVQMVSPPTNGEEDDCDALFNISPSLSDIPFEDKSCIAILTECISIELHTATDRSELARIGFISRCIPFLCFIIKDINNLPTGEKCLKWILKMVEISKPNNNGSKGDSAQIVTASLLIECFASVVKLTQKAYEASWLRNMVLRCVSFSWTLVKLYPQSLWTIKSAAALCEILVMFNMQFCEDMNEAFDILTENLRNANHCLRLHTLQVLNSFPKIPYIVNHAELNLSDDLDEEPGFMILSNQQQSSLSGYCDIIETLLKIEKIPASVESERKIMSLLTRAGLIGQSGRLPVIYAEALANHLIGIFHVKYSSLWETTSSLLGTLSKEHHQILCKTIGDALEELLCPFIPPKENFDSVCDLSPMIHHNLCISWDLSRGYDVRLFKKEIKYASQHGIVSPFLNTDRETALQEVLKVIQRVPEITAKYSRRIVPLFVLFLKNQYFLFHDKNVGARELKLDTTPQECSDWKKEMLNRKMVHQRLLSFLKAFTAVKGSQQLFQRSIMLSIFNVFLSHQDNLIAEAALNCIINFRSPRFDNYSKKLKNLFKKGGFRDALLKFPLSVECGIIENDDREELIPLILRILFGHLSASTIRSMNFKDTLASRRKTIISTISQLEKKEIFPFVYLMLRHYIPTDFELKWNEVCLDIYRKEFLRITSIEKCCTFVNMPVQWHEGFLNVLSPLILQLKHNIIDFVPTFMSILLGIIECTSPQETDSLKAYSSEIESETIRQKNPQRIRSVRSHAIRCITVLMESFAESVDFKKYYCPLWKGIAESIETLPAVVAKSNSTPSTLSLLLVLVSHTEFHPILKSETSAIDNVIKCIGPSCDDASLDITLEFILHLLNKKSPTEESNVSISLSDSQILLLMTQFRERFGEIISGEYTYQKNKLSRNTLKKMTKEVIVLRRLGELVLEKDNIGKKESEKQIFDTLSGLLLQFMEYPQFLGKDQINILRTVSSLLPRTSENNAELHFFSISKLLKYSNWIRFSPCIRSEIASVFRSIKHDGIGKGFLRISNLLEDLFAINSKHVEEMDYNRVLPALSKLADSGESGWLFFLNADISEEENFEASRKINIRLLVPIVHACFSLMQQDDAVVSRSSYIALRSLVRILAGSDIIDDISCSKFVEAFIVPGARMALKNQNEQFRRHSIFLLREVSKSFKKIDSPNLHGDMCILISDENEDLDFFINILHVQSHRRCRALQRLRTQLGNTSNEDTRKLSPTSISNILLPLLLHPIYECKTALEEVFAQECVLTVGALSQQLTWNKYNDVLWTALNRLNKHEDQEKLILGLICALLDAFHFELTTTEQNDTVVRRALERRILPKIEALLVKRVRDRRGEHSTSLRPNIVLALLKLIKKFPTQYFENQLPRYLATVCDALKNKDSNIREAARKVFGAMIIELGPEFLLKSITTLAVTLNEGFRLHVRMATIHHILLALSTVYNPTSIVSEQQQPAFDQCIPVIMDLILQDMFGAANETKESADATKHLVKEATGSKSSDSVEILCRLLYFNTINLGLKQSSIHHVVSPLFEKLEEEGVSTKSVSKIKSVLLRIVIGLSQNSSASLEDVLKFSFASIAPIIKLLKPTINQIGETTTKSSNQAVVVWQPSSSSCTKDSKSAIHGKRKDEAILRTVFDGYSAPKLTGSSRHDQLTSSLNLNGPASTCALEFGLNLFLTKMKHSNAFSDSIKIILTQFFSMLTICLCASRHNSVTILSVRCVGLLLKRGIDPPEDVLQPLSAKIIDILSNGEAIAGINLEMTQTCLTALTTLLKVQNLRNCDGKNHYGDDKSTKKISVSLSDEQVSIIISILKESMMDRESTNAPLGLIKVLIIAKFISPEFYDLMETLLDLSVRGNRESFRNQCSNIFLQFLIDYPLSKKRFKQHLRKIMLNINYKHNQGRISAIRLVSMMIERLPINLINDEAELLFLPLVLQMVNDEAEECRKLISTCISRLTCRVSTNVASSLLDYTFRWNKGSNKSLRRASLQLIGIFSDGRKDILFNSEIIVIECLFASLEDYKSDWQSNYFSLVSLEKIRKIRPEILRKQKSDLWPQVLSCLRKEHAWIRLVSSRIVWAELQDIDPSQIRSSEGACLLTKHGTLYDIASAFCFFLDADDISSELGEVAIRSLVWLSRAMSKHPDLCYAKFLKAQEVTTKSSKCTNSDTPKFMGQPIKWLFTRLSNIAKRKRGNGRQLVFKCFAAICNAVDGSEILIPHMELIIEPLNRSLSEAAGTKDATGSAKYSEEADLTVEVMSFLEESCGNAYLTALAKVKENARMKRDLRKEQQQQQLVSDPKVAAQHKIMKQIRGKARRKRRIQDHRDSRGGKMKRKYLKTDLI